ncbi:MAG: MFS transporter, partial [Ancrocorticia populi]
LLKDVPVKANIRQQLDIFGNQNTWYMTLLYVMTFGIYSGLSAQFALIINSTFGNDSQFAEQGLTGLPSGVTYAFLGPLIGSIVRVIWGPLCDKFGGAIWTFVSGVGMTATLALCAANLNPSNPDQFTPFLIGMLAFFVFAGIGNAGTFKQMPMIMPKRQAGGAIGFTAAIAAFGPFFVGMALASFSVQSFFIGCVIYCLACSVLCWVMYARKHAPFPG